MKEKCYFTRFAAETVPINRGMRSDVKLVTYLLLLHISTPPILPLMTGCYFQTNYLFLSTFQPCASFHQSVFDIPTYICPICPCILLVSFADCNVRKLFHVLSIPLSCTNLWLCPSDIKPRLLTGRKPIYLIYYFCRSCFFLRRTVFQRLYFKARQISL